MRNLVWMIAVLSLAACGFKSSTGLEDYLAAEDVADYVTENMSLIEKAFIKVNGETIKVTDLSLDDGMLVFIYEKGLVMVGLDLGKREFSREAAVIYGTFNNDDFETEEAFAPQKIKQIDSEFGHHLKGTLKNEENTVNLELLVNEAYIGAGTSKLEIGEDGHAHLSGILGTRTYVQIQELIQSKPEIKTIVFDEVQGSMNDSINVHTGRLIRNSGLNTRITAEGMIASGGVDLFTSGNERILEEGAKVGVHSWCCVDDLTADKLPKDHDGHRSQLEYFTFTLKDLGSDFYFYTLQAAPFEDVHWMSVEDIKKYQVATEVLPKS